uniref:Uncharacterized protein n=1 Tax=Arundo donax TaxID=35708 RepID=A0A0A8Y3H8_ARUDO
MGILPSGIAFVIQRSTFG